MATIKIVGLIAANALLLFAFFKVFQFIVKNWRQIEKDEEELRRQAGLRVRARSGN